MPNTSLLNHGGRSLVAALRAVVPVRTLEFSEALRTAELQANRLLELTGTTDGPVPGELITDLPGIRLEYTALPTSGMSYWTGTGWVISINSTEPPTRQRFTMFHEFKHILDHGRATRLYGSGPDREQRAEQAADYFAGCALMPKRLLKRAWGNGVQRPTALAQAFEVSPQAISVRLAQVGLAVPTPRCDARVHRNSSDRPRYFRALSTNTPRRVHLGAAA